MKHRIISAIVHDQHNKVADNIEVKTNSLISEQLNNYMFDRVFTVIELNILNLLLEQYYAKN